MNKYSLKTVLVMLLMASYFPLFAQSGVGKLVGRIVDETTNEPLVGANVLIQNTSLGAATDPDGRFFILNITPGTYNVQISYIGYGKKIIQGVRIVAGITETVNASLKSDYELTTVVVSGKKLFEEKSTNTVKVLDQGDISKLPVKGVEKLVGIQAGVVMAEGSGGADGNATINVRGGRGNEVLYIVDGVPQNDVFNGANSSQVSSSAIEQMSFQNGGFEAKYGQAQSGVVNVTTKTGDDKYSFYSDVITSSFTDDYGYNLYTVNLGGPIIPGNGNHTLFFSAERGWFKDSDPSAVSIDIPTVGYSSKTHPNLNSDVWRFSAKSLHNLGAGTLRFGANINTRNNRTYLHTYAKSNTEHNPITKTENYSYTARYSQALTNASYVNLNLGYKIVHQRSGDGVWFDNLEAYGDTTYNAPYQSTQGTRVSLDEVGLFFGKGRVSNAYTRMRNATMTLDFDYTNQLGKHLLEVGGGAQLHTLRYFVLAPAAIAIDNKTKSIEERIALQTPFYFGFDITGKNFSDVDKSATFDGKSYSVAAKPKKPLSAYFYIQDKYELNDLVLNLGLRMDYIHTKADILRNEEYPFIYGDPTDFDPADFKEKEAEIFFSPRIGIGFPVTDKTVFHAQYGKFTQQPNLIDVYTSINALTALVKDDNFQVLTGNVGSEVTTQYEIGFRQVLGEQFGSLNLTAFYKNTKGLVNDETRFFYRSEGGQRARYYGPSNSDFGTVKGVAFAVSANRLGYISLSLDYTYSLAEGTGSSTSSSTTAAFRNTNGETPKVVAPLDFDQRHTGVINFDFSVPKDDKDLSALGGLSCNILFTFNSGRPYTPLLMQNITPGGASNLGETKGYVNSAYMPGSQRIDLKIEKAFDFSGVTMTPYIWIENLLDADNVVNVYRSTGSALSTGYLSTAEGMAVAKDGGQAYIDDYKALERDPGNFGIPRLIKVGFKVNFKGVLFN